MLCLSTDQFIDDGDLDDADYAYRQGPIWLGNNSNSKWVGEPDQTLPTSEVVAPAGRDGEL